MLASPLVISLFAFGFVALLALAGLITWRNSAATDVEDRLTALVGGKKAAPKLKTSELLAEASDGMSGLAGRVGGSLSKLGLILEQADNPMTPNAFFLATAGCAFAGFAAAVLGGAPSPLYPIAALIAAGGPFGYVLFVRRQRHKKFAAQMPDALELIARALRSGHSLASGLHVVVEEMPQPVSKEFSLAYEEQNLGLPLEHALKNMLKRVPNMDLKFFVTAVAIQRSAGGDMAEILDKLSHLIRERFQIMGQVQALTGEGRISGLVLMALPVATFLAIYYINPSYIEPLFEDPRGRMMIGVATVLQVVGAVVIKKIVNIKI
ncbi:type II secretion system F family protein [Alienimonas sp. DA493]|uniref:type II secretion system F family protein n=1 Tax=Alienimonas sp. DA493 TaxID=3373605 RepID=UPI0037540C42